MASARAARRRRGCVAAAARRIGADVDFAAFEEAGAQDAVGGEAQAVAGGAERGGHGADESDAARRVARREPVDDRRSDAGFAGAVDGDQRAELAFDRLADFGFGDERVFAAVLAPHPPAGPISDVVHGPRGSPAACHQGGVAQRHVFDEAHGEPPVSDSRAKSANSSSFVPRMVTQLIFSDVEPDVSARSRPRRTAPDRPCG